ncbi:MAG: glutamine synthetase beta-grasp domain-containing protein [Proteobacteria bacterium]|nr:glutamine synthetase beta-grasp domain-containing protein [Pseudomonadota bacterium]
MHNNSNFSFAEYIWIDGVRPTSKLRSKMRILEIGRTPSLKDFPEWNFDGSSTSQANGSDSDCILRPVCFVQDPIRKEGGYIVMCEVLDSSNNSHESNTRSKLRKVLDAGAKDYEPWIGFEQEYTLFQNKKPLGWPENGFPEPQGPYYCGVGFKRVFGRDLAEHHARMCMKAGILLYGINAEVMPGQWEFQIGFRGNDKESIDALTVCDHTWIARWLLCRLGEEYGYDISFDNKPVKGDWNGAGMHTNFSTNQTRDKSNGLIAIENAIKELTSKHKDHILLYGEGLSERLTGLHETCDINTFKYGIADRGASIRIPRSVYLEKCGYFEDRRPGANADPYLVAMALCASVCNIKIVK